MVVLLTLGCADEEVAPPALPAEPADPCEGAQPTLARGEGGVVPLGEPDVVFETVRGTTGYVDLELPSDDAEVAVTSKLSAGGVPITERVVLYYDLPDWDGCTGSVTSLPLRVGDRTALCAHEGERSELAVTVGGLTTGTVSEWTFPIVYALDELTSSYCD
jgi:hypothetical protein